jgi:hypothetical protein
MPEAFDHRVVVFARPDDPADLRTVLQEKLGLNSVDAGITARRIPGVLPQNLTVGQAQAVAERISALGLRCACVPASQIPDLGHALTAHHVRCVEAGLEIFSLEGEADRRWPWGHLRLISVGRVPLEKMRYWMTDARMHAAPIPPHDYVATGERYGLEAWLIFEKPLRGLHIDSEHMNYEYLGDRKSTSGAANFELLLADLVSLAPDAFLPESTRECLVHGPLSRYDFASTEDLQRLTVTEYLLLREVQGSQAASEINGG